MSQIDEPWYREGLQFECTQCGACCTGAPGYVWVSQQEIDRLAFHLKMTSKAFGLRYLRQVGGDLSLIEKPGGDCIFWDPQQGCTVYSARPTQCRTWPFWPENLESREEWERIEGVCPGSGQGRLFTVEEIAATAKRQAES